MTEVTSPVVDDKPCFKTNPGIFKLGLARQHILAHDIGQGSQCRNESTCKCEGLDLHFWRKMCKNCGCRMDEHDVVLPNEFDHAQIVIGRLFGVKEHFEKVLTKPGMYKPTDQNDTKENNMMSSRSQPTAVYNYKMSSSDSEGSEKDGPTSKKDKVLYAWAPLPDKDLVSRYMKCLPEEERPLVGSKGEQNRKCRLQFQLPLYDCNVEDARFVEEKDVKTLQKFVENVRNNVIGVGRVVEIGKDSDEYGDDSNDFEKSMNAALKGLQVGETDCKDCSEVMKNGEIGVECHHHTKTDTYHPNCFRCETCRQLLVDNIYFFYKNKYYCGRHYADQLYPRCAGCDELIFANEYTFAEEKSWHFDHFACFKCDFKLGGSRYMTRDENPFCLECYMKHYAKTCDTCLAKIGPDEKRLNYNDIHWHAEEKCFQCVQCHSNLIGKKFILKNHKLLCSSQCKANYNSAHPNDQL